MIRVVSHESIRPNQLMIIGKRNFASIFLSLMKVSPINLGSESSSSKKLCPLEICQYSSSLYSHVQIVESFLLSIILLVGRAHEQLSDVVAELVVGVLKAV